MTTKQKIGAAVAAICILLVAYGCGQAAGTTEDGATSTATVTTPASTVTETVTETQTETVEQLSDECRRALVGMRAVAVREQGALTHYIAAINLIANGNIAGATGRVQKGTATVKATTAKLETIVDDYNNCLGQ